MTFVLLSRVLVWLLILTLVYSFFQRFYPSGSFVGRLFLALLLLIVFLSFINPTEPAVASLWRVVSFPLKPLGASILLMIFAAQRIGGKGVVDAPGGYLLGWALTILLLASTPAFAYFLARSPLAETPLTTGQGLGLEAFVPNAETLALTTRVWESYLQRVFLFLRAGS
jgi:phosphoglycerol transferase MdoB-like AlkP superfamily enzyme